MVKIKGANAQDKKEIAAARAANKADAAAAPKRQVTKRADQAPEAKPSTKAAQDAAAKQFRDADQNARSGLPADMTVEQHENHVRRAALGY